MTNDYNQSLEVLLTRLKAATRIAAESRLRNKLKRPGEIGEAEEQIRQKELREEYYTGIILAKGYGISPLLIPKTTVFFSKIDGEIRAEELKPNVKYKITNIWFIHYKWFVSLEGFGNERFPAEWFSKAPALELVG